MKYSAVVPLHNEEASIGELWRSLRPVFEGLDGPAEVIWVDDGSTDGTAVALSALSFGTIPAVVISLKTCGGMASALQTGFDRARGQILITLDGDGQNDPADIPLLIRKLEEGFDLVVGWRRERHDPVLKKTSSFFANSLQRVFLGVKIHDVGCNLRVMKKEVARRVPLRSGYHRFAAALAARAGFRVGEVPVLHHARKHGRSRFGFGSRTLQGAADFWSILRR